jgi:hypothetical protein
MLPAVVGYCAGEHPHGLGAVLGEMVLMLPSVWSENATREVLLVDVYSLSTHGKTAVASREAQWPGSKSSSQLDI